MNRNHCINYAEARWHLCENRAKMEKGRYGAQNDSMNACIVNNAKWDFYYSHPPYNSRKQR